MKKVPKKKTKGPHLLHGIQCCVLLTFPLPASVRACVCVFRVRETHRERHTESEREEGGKGRRESERASERASEIQ